MEARIQKAIDIFLDAINNGTLAKSTCAACACGNLLKDAFKDTFNLNDLIKNQELHDEFANKYSEYFFDSLASCRENPTDFNYSELLKIERAFENNTNIHWMNYYKFSKEEIRADQIKGLEAVVKVMLEFNNSKEDVKEIFTNKAELIAIN
jgi:hypothetical protein